MSDKIRGALFNILGDIKGLSVLDAFAGTGAIGLEALSRGAAHVVAIESERIVQKTILRNRNALGQQNSMQIIATTAGNWLSTTDLTAVFDLIILDPPYNRLQHDTLKRLATRVVDGGLLVVSWPGSTEPPVFEAFTQIEHRNYGDAQLIFYRRTG